MSNRQLIRPNLAELRKDAEKGPRRKTPPPESTSAEAFYYVKQIGAATPMVITLTDGEHLEGVIEWYDRACLKLNRENGPDLVVMKHAIRYMHKREDFEVKDPVEPAEPAEDKPRRRTRKAKD